MKHIYEQLRKKGLVKTPRDFSVWYMGRSKDYYANMKDRKALPQQYAILYATLTLDGLHDLAEYARRKLIALVARNTKREAKLDASKRWDVV